MQSLISKTHNLWRSSFFSKSFKIWFRFQISSKILREIFCFSDNCIWICCGNFFLLRREYLSSAVNVLSNSPKISDILRWTFSNAISTKVMKQYDESALVKPLRRFKMLTVKGCSQRRLFRHLTNHVFRSL